MNNGFKQYWFKKTQKESTPRLFSMIRNNDESGTSGTGKVLDGVVFPCGKVAVCWDPTKSNAQVDGENVNSVAVYDNWEAFEAIHIGQHPTNNTEIKILN